MGYYAVDYLGPTPDRVSNSHDSRRAQEAIRAIKENKNQWARGPRDRTMDSREVAQRQAIVAARDRQRKASRNDDEESEGVTLTKEQAQEFF